MGSPLGVFGFEEAESAAVTGGESGRTYAGGPPERFEGLSCGCAIYTHRPKTSNNTWCCTPPQSSSEPLNHCK
eukprot:166762-Rhodomonas_salina.1